MPLTRKIKPTSAWYEYQRRARWFWIASVGYVPGVALLGIPLNSLLHAAGLDTNLPFFVVAGGWMIAVTILSWRRRGFLCPRCGEPFFARWWFHNDFALRCVHCKLPKWEDPECGGAGAPQPGAGG